MTQLGYFRDKVELSLFKEWNLGSSGLGKLQWKDVTFYSLYFQSLALVYGWMDGWNNGWMDGWLDESVDGWMYRWMDG